VKVRKEAARVAVTIEAPPGGTVLLERRDGEGWSLVKEMLVQVGGTTLPWNLPPGRYRARTDDGRSARDFDVVAGSAALRVKLGGQ
jgi:hypothetical protein